MGCDSSSLTTSDRDKYSREFVVIAESDAAKIHLKDQLNKTKNPFEFLTKYSDGEKLIVHVKNAGSAAEFSQLKDALGKLGSKVLPVRFYEQENVPDDLTQRGDRYYDQHKLINSREAWTYGKGAGVLVALTDDGLDYTHEDLQGAIYTNQGEVGTDVDGQDKSTNGKDDDENGFVDDFRGWDIGRNDNDVKPEYAFHVHGTFVAGLISAISENGFGGDGIAPEAKLFPVKFRVGPRWSSVDIFKAYKYAADQGAKIINTSYDLDYYADDSIVHEALDYAYDHGLIIFNSAGNDGAEDTPRQRFDQIVLVCGLGIDGDPDKIAASSNFGRGVDLCAPISGYSTLPGNKYANRAGTSFSSAMAAGVAALIWSSNPELTRDQVVAKLIGTASRKDANNPGFEGKIGTGMVNALRAVTEKPNAPTILAGDAIRLDDQSVEVKLIIRGVLDPNSIFRIESSFYGNDGMQVDAKLLKSYRIGANEIKIRLPSSTQTGGYKIDLSQLADPFGQQIKSSHNNDFEEIVVP
jgi:subtilisin family serine protease